MKKSLVVSVILAALLAACSTAPTAPVENAAPKAATAPESKAAPAQGKVDPFKGMGALKTNPALAKRSVYFEFDSYAIPLDYVSTIEAHSKFLKANPEVKSLIQGNADERGSREYNLALGQKRAEAVKNNLKLLGVNEAQIEAVSLGEEKPKATGHDEAAWAENRRADILYTGEF